MGGFGQCLVVTMGQILEVRDDVTGSRRAGRERAEAYTNQGWLTFRQAPAAGGRVRKGERGLTVC
jgi:hypothetical protein